MIGVNGENFVVTGGIGFIGSHIVEELKKQNKKIAVIDLPYDVSVDQMCFDGIDVVFHEACSKCTVCRDDPFKDLITNAWGAFRVFDAARKAGAKVVHASTGSVNHGKPVSFYGVSKLAGEQYMRAFKEYYGLRFVGLRYHHVYGPRQDAGPNGGVVAIFITKILKGEHIQIFGDGEQVRSFTYVKDVVEANFLAANSTEMEGEYYNVASGIRISINQLIEEIEEITGEKAKREYRESKPGDIRNFNVSNDKIGEAGMKEWTSFKDGLKETVRWYSGNS